MAKIPRWAIVTVAVVVAIVAAEYVAERYYGIAPARTAAAVVWDFYFGPIERPTAEELGLVDPDASESADEAPTPARQPPAAAAATTPATVNVPAAGAEPTGDADDAVMELTEGATAGGAAAPDDAAPGTSETGPEVPTGPTPVTFALPARRTDRYVPGNVHGWSEYGISVTRPLLVRAGGELRLGGDTAGPSGLTRSQFQDGLASRGLEAARVIPSAPFLALIGRLCSDQLCSAPFVIGSQSVVCPNRIGLEGQLQLWTNNYVQVDGFQTLLTYSRAFGGYSFHAEPADGTACGDPAPAEVNSQATVAPNTVLRDPGFVISSSQTAWRPFFIPLDQPVVIRASGQMRPRIGATPTGPEGIVVPAGVEEWSYPGARQVRVDRTSILTAPGLPFQALIGRLCGSAGCAPVFAVGTARTLCPVDGFDERLELWVNYTERPSGLASGSQNQIFDALSRQLRQGQYEFEIARAPAGSCG